jgi:hypothetical protein
LSDDQAEMTGRLAAACVLSALEKGHHRLVGLAAADLFEIIVALFDGPAEFPAVVDHFRRLHVVSWEGLLGSLRSPDSAVHANLGELLAGAGVPLVKIALIGDIGGHIEVFEAALEHAVVELASRTIPADTLVVQLGDLVHKGPADDACVALADDLLGSGRYVQLWGNHDAHYVGGPDVSARPGVIKVCPNTAEVLRRWYAEGNAALALALHTEEMGPVLVTHGGLTVGLWERLGSPTSAAVAAAALNELLVDPAAAFRPGWLMTGVYDRAAGVTCPRTGAELVGPWLDATELPFTQIHGHEGVWWWPGQCFHDDCPSQVAALSGRDDDRRFCWVQIGSKRLLSIDWVLGSHAPKDHRWEPLILHGEPVM